MVIKLQIGAADGDGDSGLEYELGFDEGGGGRTGGDGI